MVLMFGVSYPYREHSLAPHHRSKNGLSTPLNYPQGWPRLFYVHPRNNSLVLQNSTNLLATLQHIRSLIFGPSGATCKAALPLLNFTWLLLIKLERARFCTCTWKSDTLKDSFLFQWETLPFSPHSANSNTSSRLSTFRQFVK